MIQINFLSEDTYFTARRRSEVWETTTVDVVSGNEADLKMNDQQLAAVLALAAAGDFGEEDGGVTDFLYKIAEEVQAGKGKLRMIP